MVRQAERENRDKVKEEAKAAVEKRGIKEKDFILPKINGKTMDVDPPYTYRSPYLESKFDSGIVTVKFGDRRWEYNVGKRTVTKVSD